MDKTDILGPLRRSCFFRRSGYEGRVSGASTFNAGVTLGPVHPVRNEF